MSVIAPYAQILQTGIADTVAAFSIIAFTDMAFPALEVQKPVYMIALELLGQVLSISLLYYETIMLFLGGEDYMDKAMSGFVFGLLANNSPKMKDKFAFLMDYTQKQIQAYMGTQNVELATDQQASNQ